MSGLKVVPLDSNNEKQHRTVIATATNELIKVRPPNDRTAAEIAAGVTPLDYGYPSRPEIDPTRYGLTETDTTGDINHAAIVSAIAVAVEMGGANIVFPPTVGTFEVNGQIKLFAGVWLVGSGMGDSGTGTRLRYVGTTFQDFITADSSSESDNIKILDLGIYGGTFRAGKARYGIYFEEFHRNCEVARCLIRESLGCIKIVSGYYSRVHHNIFRFVNPSQTTAGVSDAQFAEVYGSDTAPIHLGVMNGSDCQHNVLNTVVAEADTATQAAQIVYVSGSPVNCRNWIIESTGTAYATFAPDVTHGILCVGRADFSGLYIELVTVTGSLFRNIERGSFTLNNFFIYRATGATMFDQRAMGDMTVDDGQVYRSDFATAWHGQATGLGVGGDVIAGENIQWRSGEPKTDATLNADSDNVYDTHNTNNPLGAADGTDLRFHRKRVCFPRVVTGLVVTNASDGDGEYIQVTGGVMLSERGRYINSKFRTSGDVGTSTNSSVQRLRPQTVSSFYRVVVGKVGNVYLEESASAFTTRIGDWLAEFSTDGSGAITGLTANPRLSLRGNYVTGTSVASSGHRMSFAANDATPSVQHGSYFVTANSGATTITALDDPQFTGHEVTIEIGDANTTVDFTGTTLKGNGGADWSPANGDFMRCIYDGTNWKCSVHDAT